MGATSWYAPRRVDRPPHTRRHAIGDAVIAVLAAAATMAFQPGITESFESSTTAPPGWQLLQYVDGFSTATVQAGHAADGHHFLRLSASKPNHTRMMIPAAFEPGATYRFSAMIRASGPAPVPAMLALDASNGYTTGTTPGDGKWHEHQLYVRSDSLKDVSLVLSLGWYDKTVAGQADFDRVTLEKVDGVPTGTAVAVIPTPTIVKVGPSKAMLPLAAVLALLVIGSGGVLLRGDRVED